MTLTLPPFLPPMLVALAAGHFPDGDEVAMAKDLGEEVWGWGQAQLKQLADQQAEKAQAVTASADGEAGLAAAEGMRAAEQNLRDLAELFESLSEQLKAGARDIEFEKLVVIFTLLILAVQLTLAVAFPGGALVALARWVTAKKTIQSVYLQLLARLALNGANLLDSQPVLSILLRGGGSGAIQGGGADWAAQRVQIGLDTRDIVDRQQLLVSTVSGFTSGVAGDMAARSVQPLTDTLGQMAGTAAGPHAEWVVRLAVPAGFGGGSGAVVGAGTAVLMMGGDFGDIDLAQALFEGAAGGIIGAAGHALRPPTMPLPGPFHQVPVVPDSPGPPEPASAYANAPADSTPGTVSGTNGRAAESASQHAVPENSRSEVPAPSHGVSVPMPAQQPPSVDIGATAESSTAPAASEGLPAQKTSDEPAIAGADRSTAADRQDGGQETIRPVAAADDPKGRETAEQSRENAVTRPVGAEVDDIAATERGIQMPQDPESVRASAAETGTPESDTAAARQEPRASDSSAARQEMSRDVHEVRPVEETDTATSPTRDLPQYESGGLILPVGAVDASNAPPRAAPAAARPNQGRPPDSAGRTYAPEGGRRTPAPAETRTESVPTVFAPQERTRLSTPSDTVSASVRPPDRTDSPPVPDRGPTATKSPDDPVTPAAETAMPSPARAIDGDGPQAADTATPVSDEPGDRANSDLGLHFDELLTDPGIAPVEQYAPLEDVSHLAAVQDALRGPGDRPLIHADPSENPYGQRINDGGITEPGRANNCVQLAIDALLSYFGRPAVGRPRIDDGSKESRLGELYGGERLAAWTGQDFRRVSDARTVEDQFSRLHAEVARMGPGAAAVVAVQWKTPATDKEPAQLDGHILEVVYPEGSSGPVWWDSQSGETWHSPPEYWIEHSDELLYIPITPEDGAALAAAAGPDEFRYGLDGGRSADVRWLPEAGLAANRRESFALAAGPPVDVPGDTSNGDDARPQPGLHDTENGSSERETGTLPMPIDFSPSYSGLRQWLQAVVDSPGMDAIRFAAQAGVEPGTVYRWLDGSARPSEADMQQLRNQGMPASILQSAVERFGLRHASGVLYQLNAKLDPALAPRRFSEAGAIFGDWLRAVADDRGQTAENLARALDVSTATVDRWFQNVSAPNVRNQGRMRECLGIPSGIWKEAVKEFRNQGEGSRPPEPGTIDEKPGRVDGKRGGSAIDFPANPGRPSPYEINDSNIQHSRSGSEMRSEWLGKFNAALEERELLVARRNKMLNELTELAGDFRRKAAAHGVDVPSGTNNKHPYRSAGAVTLLFIAKFPHEFNRVKVALDNDSSFSESKRGTSKGEFDHLLKQSEIYSSLREKIRRASERVGVAAGVLYSLDPVERPDAVLLVPHDKGRTGPNVVDIASYVPASGAGPSKLVIVEAKGGGSGLGRAGVFDARNRTFRNAQQGSPQYLRRTLAIDANLRKLLNDSQSVLRARGIDPKSPAGEKVMRVVEELRQAHLNGSLEIEYHLVRANPNGTATVSRFNLDPAASTNYLPVEIDNIGGVVRTASAGSRSGGQEAHPVTRGNQRDSEEKKSRVVPQSRGEPNAQAGEVLQSAAVPVGPSSPDNLAHSAARTPDSAFDPPQAVHTSLEKIARIPNIDANNADLVRDMVGAWLGPWSRENSQYLRNIADTVAATVAATRGTVEVVVESDGPAKENGPRVITVVDRYPGEMNSRAETVWRLSPEPAEVEQAVPATGEPSRDQEDPRSGVGTAQADSAEVDRQTDRVRAQLRAEHPWMTTDQIGSATEMFAQIYAQALAGSPEPAAWVTIESVAEGHRGRGMRLTVKSILAEGRAAQLPPWHGGRDSPLSGDSAGLAAPGPHYLARTDANGRKIELTAAGRTTTHWFEIHHGSTRQAPRDARPSSTGEAGGGPLYGGRPGAGNIGEPAESGDSPARHPAASDTGRAWQAAHSATGSVLGGDVVENDSIASGPDYSDDGVSLVHILGSDGTGSEQRRLSSEQARAAAAGAAELRDIVRAETGRLEAARRELSGIVDAGRLSSDRLGSTEAIDAMLRRRLTEYLLTPEGRQDIRIAELREVLSRDHLDTDTVRELAETVGVRAGPLSSVLPGGQRRFSQQVRAAAVAELATLSAQASERESAQQMDHAVAGLAAPIERVLMRAEGVLHDQQSLDDVVGVVRLLREELAELPAGDWAAIRCDPILSRLARGEVSYSEVHRAVAAMSRRSIGISGVLRDAVAVSERRVVEAYGESSIRGAVFRARGWDEADKYSAAVAGILQGAGPSRFSGDIREQVEEFMRNVPDLDALADRANTLYYHFTPSIGAIAATGALKSGGSEDIFRMTGDHSVGVHFIKPGSWQGTEAYGTYFHYATAQETFDTRAPISDALGAIIVLPLAAIVEQTPIRSEVKTTSPDREHQASDATFRPADGATVFSYPLEKAYIIPCYSTHQVPRDERIVADPDTGRVIAARSYADPVKDLLRANGYDESWVDEHVIDVPGGLFTTPLRELDPGTQAKMRAAQEEIQARLASSGGYSDAVVLPATVQHGRQLETLDKHGTPWEGGWFSIGSSVVEHLTTIGTEAAGIGPASAAASRLSSERENERAGEPPHTELDVSRRGVDRVSGNELPRDETYEDVSVMPVADLGPLGVDPRWRTDENRLYRADNRPPDIVFRNGFVPHNNTVVDLESYIDRNIASALVGASRREDVVSELGRRYLYILDVPGGIDVDRTLVSAEGEEEILFPGGVRSEYIVGVKEWNPESREHGALQPNPNYRGGRSTGQDGAHADRTSLTGSGPADRRPQRFGGGPTPWTPKADTGQQGARVEQRGGMPGSVRATASVSRSEQAGPGGRGNDSRAGGSEDDDPVVPTVGEDGPLRLRGRSALDDLVARFGDRIVFHGSASPIEKLEPRPTSWAKDGRRYPDGEPAVCADTGYDVPMFMGLLRGHGAYGYETTAEGEIRYFAERAGAEELRDYVGYVHVLDKKHFRWVELDAPEGWPEPLERPRQPELRSTTEVRPFAIVEVKMDDFGHPVGKPHGER